MTDNSGVVGRQLAVGLAGLAVLATSTVAAVVHTADPASADTVVTSVRNAVVRTVDGTETEAVLGQRIPRGAQIRTGQGGGAELTSSGRTVYLGALTTVDVLDGVREKLARGQVMVDSRSGPRLELTTLAGTVTAAHGALARVETAAALRLGVFTGAAGITAAGRQATTAVSALHQVQVPYGFLPGQVTPLALTNDRWETRLASALVSADQDLSHLASSLDGNDGVALINAAPASLRAVLGSSGARGELALTAALAQAAPGTATDNVAQVQADRSDGGSWGVVAALINARVTSVSKLLDLALAPLAPAQPTFDAAPPVTSITDIFATPSLSPSASAKPRATSTSTTTKPTVTVTTPPPTEDPGLVGGLVTTVLGLIKPPPPPSKAPVVAPAATPTPTTLLGIIPLGK